MADNNRPQSMVQGATQVGGAVVDAMKGYPAVLMLLLVNLGFLGVLVYLMGEAVANSSARNATQLALIEKLVTDIRDCRQGPKSGRYDPTTKSLIRVVP